MRVRGQVQGVGFRFFVKNKAELLKLTGWVRNMLDESVELWAEGDRQTLQEFVSYVSRGPNQAHVTDIDLDWQSPTGQYPGFRITPTE